MLRHALSYHLQFEQRALGEFGPAPIVAQRIADHAGKVLLRRQTLIVRGRLPLRHARLLQQSCHDRKDLLLQQLVFQRGRGFLGQAIQAFALRAVCRRCLRRADA